MIASLGWRSHGWWSDISGGGWDGSALGADGGSAGDELGRGGNAGLGGSGTILNTSGSDWANGGRDINDNSGVVDNDLGGACNRWLGGGNGTDGRSGESLGADDGAPGWARNNLWPAGSDSVGSCQGNNVGGERRDGCWSGLSWWRWDNAGAVEREWWDWNAG